VRDGAVLAEVQVALVALQRHPAREDALGEDVVPIGARADGCADGWADGGTDGWVGGWMGGMGGV